jgi:hypothetical protein
MLLTWLAQQTRRILSDFHSVIFDLLLEAVDIREKVYFYNGLGY